MSQIFRNLLLRLCHAAEDMGVILGDREHAGKTGELARLFVAVNFRGRGIALGQLPVAPLPSGVYLRVMRAVHRFHGKLVAFTSLRS